MNREYYPAFLGLLEFFDGVIEPVELAPGVRIRNPLPDEVAVLTEILKDRASVTSVPRVHSKSLLVEAKWVALGAEDLTVFHEVVHEAGVKFATKAMTLIRLAHRGPATIRLLMWPLAETYDASYSTMLLGVLPPFLRSRYPSSGEKFYSRDELLGEATRAIFTEHWDATLDSVPGVRWLNKSHEERYPADALSQVVFGLEQVLLPQSNDRSYLAFKMALRAAWVLGADEAGRKSIFENCRKAYALRNKVAHGASSGSLEDGDLELWYAAEDYLRWLILKYLSDKRHFTEERLNDLCLAIPAAARTTGPTGAEEKGAALRDASK